MRVVKLILAGSIVLSIIAACAPAPYDVYVTTSAMTAMIVAVQPRLVSQ